MSKRYTLIELLVLVAIGIILLGMLYPAAMEYKNKCFNSKKIEVNKTINPTINTKIEVNK